MFGRKAGYDPKLDAIVRTEAVRLRARLERYYQAEGSRDALIIELPKGGCAATITFAGRVASGENATSELARRSRRKCRLIAVRFFFSFLSKYDGDRLWECGNLA